MLKGIEMLHDRGNNTHELSFTTIDDDLYVPKGYYIQEDNTKIIFDSGCSVSSTLFASDFVGLLLHSTKTLEDSLERPK